MKSPVSANGREAKASASIRGRPALAARLMFLLSILIVGQLAQAACVRTAPPIVASIDMGQIPVDANLAVGGTIGSRTYTVPSATTQPFLTCTAGGSYSFTIDQGAAVAGLDHVYSTNIPGVGIRLGLYQVGSTTPVYATTIFNFFPLLPLLTIIYGPGSYYKVELIKTAVTIGGGDLTSGVYAHMGGDVGGSVFTLSLSAKGTTIVAPSCVPDSSNLNVPLEPVAVSAFKGSGSTAGGKNFSVPLTCQAGVNVPQSVYLTLDALPDASNQPGVLKLTQGSGAAGGVGIQLLDKSGVPVLFQNPALVGPSINGKYSVPYTARYYQTGTKVTPGVANGTATFTVSYK